MNLVPANEWAEGLPSQGGAIDWSHYVRRIQANCLLFAAQRCRDLREAKSGVRPEDLMTFLAGSAGEWGRGLPDSGIFNPEFRKDAAHKSP